MKKYSSTEIHNLANELATELARLEIADDMCIYFNNYRLNSKGYGEDLTWIFDIDHCYYPQDYCEYAPERNIVCFSTEGPLYDYYYNKCEFPKSIQAIFDKYDVYSECCTNWFFALCPSTSDWEDWETSPGRDPNYVPPEEPIVLGRGANAPKALIAIKEMYDALVESSPDEGSCVLGAHIRFKSDGKLYALYPPYSAQGSLTWERWNGKIIELLEALGCTNIYYNPGHMD